MERKPEDIVKEIDETRTRLVGTLGALAERLQPEALVRRQVQRVRNFYVDEASGAINQERALRTGGILAGLLVLRRLFR